MSVTLVVLQDHDLETVKSIYDYYIVNSTATFHLNKISIDELRQTIVIGHPKYQSFIIKYNDDTCGYCYISQFKKREAYDRSAEITIYLKPEFFGKGIGKQAIEQLETCAKNNKISVLIGIISGDNSQSIKLFEKCGIRQMWSS
jgi:L-amino acid N-acyltransferase YncA